MKKVVIKAYLPERTALEQRLGAAGLELAPAVWQHERIYHPSNFQPHSNHPRLVLRTEVADAEQPAAYSLYLKRHIEDSGIDWWHLTSVGDYTAAAAIIHQLGYHKVAEISRQRQALSLDDHIVLYLDTIEGLEGCFVKVEGELTDQISATSIRELLFETLRLLGIETFIMQTYAELFQDPMQPYYLP